MNYEFYLEKKSLRFIFIYFLALISFIFYYFNSDLKNLTLLSDGYILGNDSVVYIDSAKEFLEGNFLNQNKYTYISYSLFLALLLFFKFNLAQIAIAQILMSLIAGYCLYKITKKLFNESSGYICMTLFLIYIPLQKYHFYILTDGFCSNFYIYSLYYIVFFKKKFINILLLLITVMILFFSRGHGIFIIPAIIMAYFFYLLKKKELKKMIILLIPSIIFSIIFLIFINNKQESSAVIEILFDKWQNREWGIIFGYTTDLDREILKKLYFPKNLDNTVGEYFNFIRINFLEYIKLFFLKIFYCLMRFRPFFSNSHNYYLIFFSIIFYSSFIFGVIKLNKFYFFKYLILSIIFMNLLFVGLTFVDWDSRFSIYFLPLILIFSSIGIDNNSINSKLRLLLIRTKN